MRLMWLTSFEKKDPDLSYWLDPEERKPWLEHFSLPTALSPLMDEDDEYYRKWWLSFFRAEKIVLERKCKEFEYMFGRLREWKEWEELRKIAAAARDKWKKAEETKAKHAKGYFREDACSAAMRAKEDHALACQEERDYMFKFLIPEIRRMQQGDEFLAAAKRLKELTRLYL